MGRGDDKGEESGGGDGPGSADVQKSPRANVRNVTILRGPGPARRELNAGTPPPVQSHMSTQHTRPFGQRAAGALLSLALTLPAGAAPTATAPAAEDVKIVHALNRLGFGPRPGDVEAVRRLGLSRWIDQQLHPERIDDHALDARLLSLRTLKLDSSALLARYDLPREAKREIQKKRAEMEAQTTPGMEGDDETRKAAYRRELMQKYRGQLDGPPRQVVAELQEAKLLRAIYSERQLDEVLVDFWMNHFNVFAGKGPVKFMVGQYERDAIRPHAWGRFEDLLKASARSPAMLFYLDNWLSADPDAQAARGQGRFGRRRARFGAAGPQRPEEGRQKGRKRGLNENYAREIMELHTLGVDGGYTQKDVTEVARCFTGWTIKGLGQDHPEFTFDERLHDRGDKVVLGHVIKGGGQGESDAVIHLLATAPATARFVSYKLARRFVADEPPRELVDRAAETFRRTQGDIREVVKAIVTAPEFYAPATLSAKVKTPFEFVASAARAASAEVSDAGELSRRLATMGMPLYMQQPPTGYKDTAEAWVSTSGLLARLNLALDLAAGRVNGVSINATALGEAGLSPDGVARRLLPTGLSEATRKTLQSEAAGAPSVKLAGLILGSPEFQRR